MFDFIVGTSVLKAKQFAMFLDGVPINTNICSFMEAWAVMFPTYYVFNIEYVQKGAGTLEFFQR